MSYNNFFWLHIKKSAGISTRKLLQPYYKEVDRVKRPKNFIQSSPAEYNDILNNYRLILGEYQFKRALFAKKYLYDQDSWSKTFSFAFSREPLDRCLSMFYYLHYGNKSFLEKYIDLSKQIRAKKKIGFSISYDFDVFIDLIYESHFKSESNFKPVDLHFSTHTASMFSDVTDKKGKIILNKIYRLENLYSGIDEVFKACNFPNLNNLTDVNKNKNTKRGNYIPNSEQRKRIQELYHRDYELYENSK